jgi:hypothetical protein
MPTSGDPRKRQHQDQKDNTKDKIRPEDKDTNDEFFKNQTKTKDQKGKTRHSKDHRKDQTRAYERRE